MVEQEKLISALTSAVTTAEKSPIIPKSSISPQSSTKSNRDQSIDENKLKQALAEKQTLLWELEGNKEKDKERIVALTKANKSLEIQFKDLEDKYRQQKASAKNEIEIEKREKRELEKELKLVRQNTVESDVMTLNNHSDNKFVEMQLKLEESKDVIDLITRRNEELKEEIRQLKAEIEDVKSKPSDKLEVEGLVKSSMNESISINDFTEWSKDLDSLKKRNDQLLCRNKQLSSDNAKLTERVEKNKSAIEECVLLKTDNDNLKESIEDLKAKIHTKEAEISSLNERIQGIQEDSSFDDYQEKYYEMYEKYQQLESMMGGTIDKLKFKVKGVEEEKVQLQNTINELNTTLDSKKRELKEFDYMKNRVEMMEMEHAHLKEFSSQLIEENKQIDEIKKESFEKDQALEDFRAQIREQDKELVFLRGMEKANASTQADDMLVQDLESKLEEATGKVDSRNAILDSLNGKISQREEEITKMKNILSDFEATNGFMTGEIQKLQKQNSSLEGKLNKRNEELANFKDIMDALNEQISSSAKQCAGGQCAKVLEIKELHAAEIKILEDTLKDSKTVSDKYSAITGELTQLQSRHEYLEDELSVMEADKADLEEQNDIYSQVIKDKDSEISELLALNSSLRDEVDTGNRKISEITEKRDELAKEMVSVRQKRADVELQLNELQDEHHAAKRKLTVSKDQVESLQTLNEAVTAQLREMQENDCAKGTCPKSQDLLKDIEKRDEDKKELSKEIADLQYQRKDLQEVIIRSKNELAEKELECQELEGSCSEYEKEIKNLKGQIRSLQRKIDPKKVKKDLVDNLENQVEMYQVEVMSLKSVTRNLEDQVERMSVMEQETTDEMFELNKRNASLDKQLGDANEEIQDLEAQLEKLKEGIRESQKESAMVDTYLTEREMMKDSIASLENENKVLKEENHKSKNTLTEIKEELSIIKGVRDSQTRDNALTKADVIKLKKEKDSLKHELVRANTSIQKRELEIQKLRDTLNTSDMFNHIDTTHNTEVDGDESLSQSDLYNTISDLSMKVKNLTEENEALEGSIAETNNEEKLRQQKIVELEKEFKEDIEDVHKQYKDILEKKDSEINHWVTSYQSLSQEYVVLEEQRNNLEKLTNNQPIPEQFEMQNALQEKEDELTLKCQMAEKTFEQFQETQIQLEETENELLTYKKKCNGVEKNLQDLSSKLAQNEQQIEEYKQKIEDMNTADENKRSEIRLLNKMIKEYTSKAEDAELEYSSLKDKYNDKKTKIEQLQKEIMQLKNSNVEYENVIVALESTSASESLDVSTKTKRIAELEALLTETENDANQKISELENSRSEARRLQEENEQLIEEVKSYQDEWRRLTNLLNSVNHTNSANMDSCKRLETKLEDIEFKVTEANVHIDVCQGDMFSKTESLVRENGILEQKVVEKTQSLEQSEKFLRESHENVSLLQNSLAEAQKRYETLQRVLKEKESKIDSLLHNDSSGTSVELQRKIRELSDELADKEGLLEESHAERKLDESSFKMSLDTIVRSYESKIEILTEENASQIEQINKLKSEIEESQLR